MLNGLKRRNIYIIEQNNRPRKMTIDFRKSVDNILPFPQVINNMIAEKLYDGEFVAVENKRMYDLGKIKDMLNEEQLQEFEKYKKFVNDEYERIYNRKYCSYSFRVGEQYKRDIYFDGRCCQYKYTVIKKTPKFITVKNEISGNKTRHMIKYNEKNDEWIKVGNYRGAPSLYAVDRID